MNYSGWCFVNVYELDRCYGGGEEGGWWYDVGEAIKSRPCKDREEAIRIRDRWNRYLDAIVNRGRPPLSSVNCYGIVRAMIGDAPAADFPEVRPHYE